MDEKQAAYSSHQIAYVPGAIDEDVFKQAVLSKVAVWQGRLFAGRLHWCAHVGSNT